MRVDFEIAVVHDLVDSEWQLEPLTDADVRRTADVMQEYRDARIDSADASLVAVAERMAPCGYIRWIDGISR